jgi:hypothetical protein
MGSASATEDEEDVLDYLASPLSIVIVGASGDLAKKKTYPSLFSLVLDNFVADHTKCAAAPLSLLHPGTHTSPCYLQVCRICKASDG